MKDLDDYVTSNSSGSRYTPLYVLNPMLTLPYMARYSISLVPICRKSSYTDPFWMTGNVKNYVKYSWAIGSQRTMKVIITSTAGGLT